VGHVACMGEERKVYKVLVVKPEGNRPIGRPRHRRGRMGSEWILWKCAGRVEWIQLAGEIGRWQVVVNAVMNLRVPAPQS
jgi:hypothetical protein